MKSIRILEDWITWRAIIIAKSILTAGYILDDEANHVMLESLDSHLIREYAIDKGFDDFDEVMPLYVDLLADEVERVMVAQLTLRPLGPSPTLEQSLSEEPPMSLDTID